jgi:hypothetical protein
MSSPLLTRDGRHLATPAQPGWLRHLLVWTVPLAAVAVLAITASGTPEATCSDSAPCTADPLGSVVLGLFVASALVAVAHAGVGAALGVAFVLGSLGYDGLNPQTASPWWADATIVGYALVCLAVARARRPRPARDVAFGWLARTPYATPPTPARLPGPDRRMLALVGLALLGATLVVGYGLHRQDEADAQQQAARVVIAEVVGRPDEYTVQVRLPDATAEATAASTISLTMLDADHHPVGSRLSLRMDDAGLRQPVSEEYDASGWYLPAVLLFGLALAGAGRIRQHRHGLRRLFTEAQPVSAVYVCETWDRLAVYPADARAGEPAIAELRLWRDSAEPVPPALLDGDLDGGFGRDEDDVELPEPRAALLYGVPAPGQWCTVAVDGAPRLPVRPLRAHFSAPPFVPRGMSADEPVGVDLPLRPEELAALAGADRDDDPFALREHAGHPGLAYLRIGILAFGLVALTRLLPALPFLVSFAVCLAAVAIATEVGWRLWLRPRLAWNGGGLAVVGLLGAQRLAWSEVYHISADRGAVIVAARETALIVPAGGGLSWPAGAARRSAVELALALRHARHRALASGAADLMAPPALAVPARPGALAALWLALGLLLAVARYLTM